MTINSINREFNTNFECANPTINHTLIGDEQGYVRILEFDSCSVVATGASRQISSSSQNKKLEIYAPDADFAAIQASDDFNDND